MQVQVNHTKTQFFCLFPVLCLKKKNLCTIPQKWAFERGVSLTMREKTHFWRSSGTCMYANSSQAILYCHNGHHRLIKPPLRQFCHRRGWDLCVYVCMHKNKIKKLWHHCHEQLILSTPLQGKLASTPLTNLLTRPSVTARTATMTVKPKPSKVHGSTAKKRVSAWRTLESSLTNQNQGSLSSSQKLHWCLHLHYRSLHAGSWVTRSFITNVCPSISNWKEGLSTRHGLTNIQKVKTICW